MDNNGVALVFIVVFVDDNNGVVIVIVFVFVDDNEGVVFFVHYDGEGAAIFRDSVAPAGGAEMVRPLLSSLSLSQLQGQLAAAADRDVRVADNGRSIAPGGRLARLASALQRLLDRLPFARGGARAERQRATVDGVRVMLKDRFPHERVDAALKKIQSPGGAMRATSLNETISDLSRANVETRSAANHLIRNLRPQTIMNGDDENLKATLKAVGYDETTSVRARDNFRRVFGQVLDGFVSHKAIVNGVNYGAERPVRAMETPLTKSRDPEKQMRDALAEFERDIKTRGTTNGVANDAAGETTKRVSARRDASPLPLPRRLSPDGAPPKPLRAGAADRGAFAVGLAAKAAAGFLENPGGIGRYEADMDAARYSLELAVSRAAQSDASPAEVAREVARYNRHLNDALDALNTAARDWLTDADKDRVSLALETHIAKQVISDVAARARDRAASARDRAGKSDTAAVSLTPDALNAVFVNRGDSLAAVFHGARLAMHDVARAANGAADPETARLQSLASPRGFARFFDLYSRTLGTDEFVRPPWLEGVLKNPGGDNSDVARLAAMRGAGEVGAVHVALGGADPRGGAV